LCCAYIPQKPETTQDWMKLYEDFKNGRLKKPSGELIKTQKDLAEVIDVVPPEVSRVFKNIEEMEKMRESKTYKRIKGESEDVRSLRNQIEALADELRGLTTRVDDLIAAQSKGEGSRPSTGEVVIKPDGTYEVKSARAAEVVAVTSAKDEAAFRKTLLEKVDGRFGSIDKKLDMLIDIFKNFVEGKPRKRSLAEREAVLADMEKQLEEVEEKETFPKEEKKVKVKIVSGEET